MQVAARGDITLACVVDIQGVYRYYLLQSSTLAAPAKPTAKPPGGNWDDTEPAYTEGSTNSLYTVERTDYCDGTWVYSPVSLSSAYEAAKQAYNKAAAASGAADAAQADVDALAETTTEKISELAVLTDGITAQVTKNAQDLEQTKQDMTALRQTAEGVSVTVQRILDNGVDKVTTQTGYTFNDDGLRITKSGQEIENLLDNTGMYVTRSGETVLQVNNQGVLAADVTVRNYLVVGDHARFEDYGEGRTACFYI